MAEEQKAVVHREAMTAKMLVEEMNKELLNCEVCLEEKTRSRLLQCGHSFCLSCTELLAGKAAKVSCPVCRQLTPGRLVKSDFRDQKLHDLHAQLLAHEQQHRRCDICLTKVRVSEQNYQQVCLVCNIFFCSACLNKHQNLCVKVPIQIDDKTMLSSTICSKHLANLKTFYCETCSKPMCLSCVSEPDHSQHKLIKHQDKLDTSQHTLCSNLKRVRHNFDQVLEQKQRTLSRGGSLNFINQFALQMLDDFKCRLRKLADKKNFTYCVERLEEMNKELDSMQVELEICEAALNDMMEDAEHAQPNVMEGKEYTEPVTKKPRLL